MRVIIWPICIEFTYEKFWWWKFDHIHYCKFTFCFGFIKTLIAIDPENIWIFIKKFLMVSKACLAAQIDAFSSVSDWLIFIKRRLDWLRGPTSQHQFENLSYSTVQRLRYFKNVSWNIADYRAVVLQHNKRKSDVLSEILPLGHRQRLYLLRDNHDYLWDLSSDLDFSAQNRCFK